MSDNGGAASWKFIYDNIEKYYPPAKVSAEWKAGMRGVLYREIKNNKNFKKIGFGIFALKDYSEEEQMFKIKKDKIRMHSYIEGLMVELGNYEKFDTYCADPSAIIQPNVFVNQLVSLNQLPNFTYTEIINIAKRIDVIWFTKNMQKFPKKAVEVIDSIGTLGESLSRLYQLKEFQTEFVILIPSEFKSKLTSYLNREPYLQEKERFKLKTYDELIRYYKNRLELEKNKLF